MVCGGRGRGAETMTSEESGTGLGTPLFGVGVMALAAVALVFGGFDPGQPVPKFIPGRAELAVAAALFMLVCGAAMSWRPVRAAAAAALAVYYGAIVVLLMNGRVVLAHPGEYAAYSSAAEQLAIAAGALTIYAGAAEIDASRAALLRQAGRMTFGLCAVLFGGAHFVYLDLTAPLVPKWLPPSQVFWAYATGVFHIAGGVALLVGIRARLAAILLTAMYAAFTPLVHIPLLLADPASHANWAENAENLALTGVAWALADSLARRRRFS